MWVFFRKHNRNQHYFHGRNIQTNILSSSPITVETAKVEQEPSPTKKKWSWNTPTSFIVGVPILEWFLDSLEHIAHLCHPRTKKASKLLQHILPLRSNLHSSFVGSTETHMMSRPIDVSIKEVAPGRSPKHIGLENHLPTLLPLDLTH